MKISLLQLNMWAGTHFTEIAKYLEHNHFDMLCFQEVTGIGTAQGNVKSRSDYFKELQILLGNTYNGELLISQYTTSAPQTGYFGNAIFYRKDFTFKAKHDLWLLKRNSPFPSHKTSFEEVGRNLLHLTLEKDQKRIEVITTHLAWAKTQYEQPHQREQNLKLIEYMKHVARPWILTGDFNIASNQQSILDLEQLGHNLTKEYHIVNTIDSVNHHAWEKLQPGFSVDYIFVSPDVQVNSFEALTAIHMSDHIGLIAEIEI